MINSVSSAAPSTTPPVTDLNTPRHKPQPAQSSTPQDSVQLSSKAQGQGSGDVDNDGDNH